MLNSLFTTTEMKELRAAQMDMVYRGITAIRPFKNEKSAITVAASEILVILHNALGATIMKGVTLAHAVGMVEGAGVMLGKTPDSSKFQEGADVYSLILLVRDIAMTESLVFVKAQDANMKAIEKDLQKIAQKSGLTKKTIGELAGA